MKLTEQGHYSGNLILVNGEFPMRGPDPADLVPVSADYPHIRLRREAQAALAALLREIGAGDKIVPVSGYRSRQEQESIYRSSLRENGAEFTAQFVARPGHSEHQTGLAIDLALNQKEIDFICPEFPDYGICGEFRRQAARFGFIQRYPAGKEAITGIASEPWHFRYVGCPHAAIMAGSRLTLEEYTACLKHFRGFDSRLRWPEGERQAEVFYISGISELVLPFRCGCEVSGNNDDGFIVTLWRNGR